MQPTSIRDVMRSSFAPIAGQLEYLGQTNARYEALRNGEDVTLTPAELRYAPDHPEYPEDLDEFESWTLSGPNTLTGVA